MWTLPRAPSLLVALVLTAGVAASANGQDEGTVDAAGIGSPYYYPDRSSIYNQNSVALPSMATPYGQDEVRSAAGVACRSSVASAGPYMDMGVIGSSDVYNRDGAAVYGRVVIPLGERPRRVDCTSLYRLEIQRLQMELELMRMGLAAGTAFAGVPAEDLGEAE